MKTPLLPVVLWMALPFLASCEYLPKDQPFSLPIPGPPPSPESPSDPWLGQPAPSEPEDLFGYYFKPGIPWVGQATDSKGRTFQVRLDIHSRRGGEFEGVWIWKNYHNKHSSVQGTLFGTHVSFTENRNWNDPQMTNGTHHDCRLEGKLLRGSFRGGPDRAGGTYELRPSGPYAED